MATRRERVVLDLEDNLTPGLARAAVAASLLDKNLDHLGGTSSSASKDVDEIGASAERAGTRAGRGGAEIDKLSGRFRVLADAALVLGPALIPIGGAAIPALSAALSGLGAAAGGIGVAVLALHGIGDGLKAIDAYQLEPTAANLQKLHVEMEKLGPAGAGFVQFLDDLEPKLSHLQTVARDGLFPGVEEGITNLLTRLPEVRDIVNRLAQEMGRLSADSGKALSSEAWTSFFDYVKHDAAPTLDDFARSTGNVALGFANLLVAFAPASETFSSGMLKMSDRFAEWSKGLDENQGFQDFLAYIEQTGPEVLALLGALVQVFTGITRAAGPFGQVLLPVLTAVAKVFAAIADSPIGPALYVAFAATRIYARGADLAATSTTRLSTAMGRLSKVEIGARAGAGLALLALSATDVDEKLGLANTAMDAMAGLMVGGPWGLAIGGGIGLAQDFAAANNSMADAVTSANQALASGNTDKMQTALEAINKQVEQFNKDSAETNPLQGGFWRSLTEDFPGLSHTAHDAAVKQAELQRSLSQTNVFAKLLAPTVGLTADQLYNASHAAQAFSDALANLNGWLDKRQAIRDYHDNIDTLTKSLKDGFQPKDAANIDAVGRSISQIASQIKDRSLRADFLSNARAGLADLASKSGPQAQAAIAKVIGALDRFGLTKPPPAKLDADDSGVRKAANSSRQLLAELTGKPYSAKLTADGHQAIVTVNQVAAALGRLHDKTIKVTVSEQRVGAGGQGNNLTGTGADGATVPKDNLPYGDRYHYLLAPGEQVITNRHGEADKFRADRSAGRIPAYGRLADGGEAGHPHSAGPHSVFVPNFGIPAAEYKAYLASLREISRGGHAAAVALHGLEAQSKSTQKQYDKAKATLSTDKSNRDSLASTIADSLGPSDVFSLQGAHDASGNPWAAGAQQASAGVFNPTAALNQVTANAQAFLANIKTLQAKGVKGAALQAILSEGPAVVAAMAAMSAADLGVEVTAFTTASAAVTQAGQFGGNAVWGQIVAHDTKNFNMLHTDLQQIKAVLNIANVETKKNHRQEKAHNAAAAKAKRRARNT